MSEEKTNVMRLLEQKKVPYTPHQYPHQGGMAVDGATVAAVLGRDPASVFKTLVTRGATKANYVFVVPVLAELDLKKAARAVGEKSIEMIHVKELTPLTGYVRGGCSPIGMKKRFKTVSRRPGRHPGQRGQNRLSGGACPGGSGRTGGRRLCRYYKGMTP